MPHRLYPQVANRARHICEYCRAPESDSSEQFQVEHIRPTARGGQDDLSNVALSCPRCNRWKSHATHALDRHSGMAVALFNPRRDAWAEHFRADRQRTTFTIVGLTPTGRATVERLGMNDGHMIRARSFWAAIGLSPPR